MAYTALYRKKRPLRFSGVIGQPHVVRTLKNQLAAGHISHAYLFCGTRGTGKTSAAKIFSRAVNCEQPLDGEPCNECETCRGILAERNMGVIEIDAASNNGVENIRDLREEVKYPPTEGRYRVYIIDEAHMLTNNAFNALLKTLEEPPAHVVFILATTDPQKIPPTILSRCQRYDFKRLTVTDMVDTLQAYMQEEGAVVEEDALRYIASVSDGAMRDALSILDQSLSHFEGETITLSKVLTLLGAVDRQVLFDFTDAIAAFDSGRVLDIINGVVRDGRDIGQFAADILRHLRDLLVASQITKLGELLDYSEETAKKIKVQSSAFSSETLIGYIRLWSELQNELRYATQARMALEVCAVKLCHPETSERYESLFARLEQLERRVAAGVINTAGVEEWAVSSDNMKEPQNSVTPKMTVPSANEEMEASAPSVNGEMEASAPSANEEMEASAPSAYDEPEMSAPSAYDEMGTSAPSMYDELEAAVPSAYDVPDAAVSSAVINPEPDIPVATAESVTIHEDTVQLIQKQWASFCGDFSPPLKFFLLHCGIESYNGMLRIICDNETNVQLIKDKQSQLQEKLVSRFKLSAPPNLAFIVRDDYNIVQNTTQEATPGAGQPEPRPTQQEDAWAAFGKQVEMDAAW